MLAAFKHNSRVFEWQNVGIAVFDRVLRIHLQQFLVLLRQRCFVQSLEFTAYIDLLQGGEPLGQRQCLFVCLLLGREIHQTGV
jgi:hypothetical protein